MLTQFLGALNDNIFKLVVSLIIVNEAMRTGAGTGALSLTAGLFVAPYVLFAAPAGALNDRFAKTRVIRALKIMEVAVMLAGAWFFMHVSVVALLSVLFLMGLQSALFSPAKYGILVEILEPEELSRGNGFIQFWTFVAIILGTSFGSILKALSLDSYLLPALTVIVIAVLGFAASLFVAPTVAQQASTPIPLNPFSGVIAEVKTIQKRRSLFLTLLAITFFWFVGTIFQVNAIFYAKQLAALSDLQTGVMLTVFALGLGGGSLFAGKVSAGKVELGLVPLGGLGMALFSTALGFVSGSYFLILIVLAGLGLSGGFFIVPLQAFFQKKCPDDRRGRHLAALNFISSLGMVVGSLVFWALTDLLKLDGGLVFIFIGSVSLLVSVWICALMPEMLVRCLNWIFTHTIYRINVIGAEHVPESGGAMIVANHVSFVDPPLVQAAIERPVRFLTWRPIYESKLVNPVARTMKAIPVSSGDTPEQKADALQKAREFIQAGELLGNFAEGGITRTGELNTFKRGLEQIMTGIDAPIIPAYLDELWGSIFSYERGRFFWKRPKRIPYPVTIIFGQPLAGSSTAEEVQAAVESLKAKLEHARETQGN